MNESESFNQSTVGDDPVTAEGAPADAAAGDEPGAPDAPAPMTRLALIGLIGVGVLAVAWFGVSWAVLHSPVVDAVGEALGGVLLILVLASAVGAVRGTR